VKRLRNQIGRRQELRGHKFPCLLSSVTLCSASSFGLRLYSPRTARRARRRVHSLNLTHENGFSESLQRYHSKMPEHGMCRLCLKEGHLQNSHFFPASIYKVCRDAENQKNPIAMMDNVAAETSGQMTAYLLCAECEQRFNRNGERWVHLNIATPEGFPIQEALAKREPIISGEKIAAYAGAQIEEIQVEKLVYFGLSIFWRAATCRWRFSDTDRMTERLALGPYEEPIRQFLVGGSDFPDHVVILISVWPYKDTSPPIAFHTPASQNKGDFHSHQFYVPGLDFKLAVGKRMPEMMRRICTHRSPEKMIIASTNAAKETIETLSRVIDRSVPKGKLAARYPK
jgi:hypothetical protein